PSHVSWRFICCPIHGAAFSMKKGTISSFEELVIALPVIPSCCSRGFPMTNKINVPVNGVSHQSEVEPRMLLVHYLRDALNLTGTHIGCETSLCGACTVLVDGQAVKSCTLFAVQADGSKVTTIEGFAKNGKLHP